MRRALVLLTVFCIGGGLVGCAKKTAVNPPVKTGGDQVRATENWTIKLQAKCADGTEDSQCLAKYGFSVNSDGQYQAGVAEGSPRTGTIQQEELAKLKSAMASTLALSRFDLQGHDALPEEAAFEETVTFS